MAKSKGTNGYVAEINAALRKQLGLSGTDKIPVQFNILIRKTAGDMLILDRISEQLLETELVSTEIGSMGQTKQAVNPLVPYYDKMSARVTDDLYNLGLTARKQAAKGDDAGEKKVTDNIGSLLAEMRG